MSDHYFFNLHFRVRYDAPAQLHAALAKRAVGEFPTLEEISDLPGIVQTYLRNGGVPGDGIHDDEHFNGRMYYPYWLYQCAAYDGPLGTMQQTNGADLPSILTKADGHIIETTLAYGPAKFWPTQGQAPPDPETPMVIEKSTSVPLSEIIASLADFSDGHSYV